MICRPSSRCGTAPWPRPDSGLLPGTLGLALALLVAGLASPPPLAGQTGPVPTPESVLGYAPGADFHLADYQDALAYLRRLDQASDLVELREVGRTTSGQPWFVALISSAENLRNLERHREISRRLAHPEGLPRAEARALAREGRAFVDISGGLHASEVAGAQHTLALAYDLVSRAAEPEMKLILDNTVLILWPSLNPDGQDMVAEWYRQNLGTPYEVSPMPRLYQEYVGHDNNRDAYMLNMVESRVVERTWRDWEPQIIHVHHQTSPFPTRIWLPPFAEPIATRAPPLISREVNMIGMAMAQGLESRGLEGATHMGTGFDAWYAGYIDYLPLFQNQAAFWTETALYAYATPRFYTISDFPADKRELRPESLYPSPWKGGWWRLADAVEYMEAASLSVLDYAARYREELLFNRWQSGAAVIARYRAEPPFAYLVPQEQRDPVAPVELLRRLAFNGVRVHRLREAATVGGREYPAGTWVVRLDQEFGELVRQVMDVQRYPDLREYPEGPPEQPYDAAGWTLPLQMGVRVVAARQPLTEEVLERLEAVRGDPVDWKEAGGVGAAAMDPSVGPSAETVGDASPFDSPPGVGFDTDPVAAGILPLPGRLTGSGPNLAVDPAQNNAFRVLGEAWAAGGRVSFLPGGPDGGEDHGWYVVAGVPASRQESWVRDLALQARRTSRAGDPLPAPRVALYRPYNASMDEGWTRWLLERYRIPFTNVSPADAQAGELRGRFDVIILPGERPASLLNGYARGSVPPQWEGGLGPEGVRALDAFVQEGGTLVCLNQSAELAIDELHLPVENVVGGLPRDEFFVAGSILEVVTDPSHRVMAGMPARAPVFVNASPVFRTLEGFEGKVLAHYADKGSPLLSGYLLGEDRIQGMAAALDVKHGQGHVVMLGFRPQWRGQPFGSFRVLFNAALYAGVGWEQGPSR